MSGLEMLSNMNFWRTQIPMLRSNKLGDFPDQCDLIPFVQRGNRTTYQGPKKSYIVRWEGRWPDIKAERVYFSLFVPDNLLEDIWANLRTWTLQVKKYGAYAIMGVSYSIWEDDPFPVQLYNLWRIRFTERYLQDHDIYVIPTLDTSPLLRSLSIMSLPPFLPAACIDMQIAVKQGSISSIAWQTYSSELADHTRIDTLYFNGVQSRKNKLWALKNRVASRHLFGSWGHEYRQLLAEKRLQKQHLMPSVPTQRKLVLR